MSSGEASPQKFRGLERATELIARQPYFPGKAEAVRECLDDIEEQLSRGELSQEQRDRLVALLRQSEGGAPDRADQRCGASCSRGEPRG